MKTRHLALCVSLIGFSWLAGCATTRSQIAFYEEERTGDPEAIVYVYRLKSIVGAVAPWRVYLDREAVGVLSQGAYVPLHVSPGPHSIAVGDPGSPVIPLVAGGAGGPVAAGAAAGAQGAMTGIGPTFEAQAYGTYYLRCKGFSAKFVTKEKAMPELSLMKYDTGR